MRPPLGLVGTAAAKQFSSGGWCCCRLFRGLYRSRGSTGLLLFLLYNSVNNLKRKEEIPLTFLNFVVKNTNNPYYLQLVCKKTANCCRNRRTSSKSNGATRKEPTQGASSFDRERISITQHQDIYLRYSSSRRPQKLSCCSALCQLG